MTLFLAKSELRTELRQRRVRLAERDKRGERIQQSAIDLPGLCSANEVMVYVGCRSEVSTQSLIDRLLQTEKAVFIPWCEGNELHLFRLESRAELVDGAYGIPEPSVTLRALPDRQGDPQQLDLIFVPGLGFDRRGGRLGQGKGYYDRLFSKCSAKTRLIGLAFDAQVVENIPMEPHDVRLHAIITESETIFA